MADQLELSNVLMLKNVNRLTNAETCLHFLASKLKLACIINETG